MYKNKVEVNKKVVTIFYTIAIFSFLIDFVSKILVQNYLSTSKINLLGEWLYIKLVYNPGAAFSFLSGNAWVFTVFAIVVCGFILYISPKIYSKNWSIALGILFGGTIGNLVDRIFMPPYYGQGHVVDFIGYGNWFIGNIADIFIVLGVAFIVILELKGIEYLKPKND